MAGAAASLNRPTKDSWRPWSVGSVVVPRSSDAAKASSSIASLFGDLRRNDQEEHEPGCFLTRGLRNVGTELSLSVLAYDLLRAIDILGVPRTIKALP